VCEVASQLAWGSKWVKQGSSQPREEGEVEATDCHVHELFDWLGRMKALVGESVSLTSSD
jgi:hypothetical protein